MKKTSSFYLNEKQSSNQKKMRKFAVKARLLTRQHTADLPRISHVYQNKSFDHQKLMAHYCDAYLTQAPTSSKDLQASPDAKYSLNFGAAYEQHEVSQAPSLPLKKWLSPF